MRRSKAVVKALAASAGALALWLPGTALLTLLLAPLWAWVESRTGIECLGHSGPAGWCFVATGAALAGAALVRAGWRRRTRRRPG